LAELSGAYLADARVDFGGALHQPQVALSFDTGCPARWNESLDRLARTDFALLIPGHGPPLTRKQFDLYRAAFGHLLTCAGGSDTKQSCIDGWLRDVTLLIPKNDAGFTRMLMAYYVDVLKRSPEDVAKLCGK